jgi:hypothetical protein
VIFPPDQAGYRRMNRLRRPLQVLGAVLKALVLVGCNLTQGLPALAPSPPPATDTPPATILPTEAVDPDGWVTVADGVERRVLTPDGLTGFSQVILHRLDPQRVALRAHVAAAPLRLEGWREALPEALGFVNANFFDRALQPLGLVVSDGAALGQTFVNRGGMVQVVGGVPSVRSLIEQPYLGEPLEQAVQAFPMLVVGRQPVYQEPRLDRTSRRTAVAQDSQGRIILLTTPLIGMTLNELAGFLATDPTLDIVYALNLDGGGSTMLYAPLGAELPSFDAVPVVLAFYRR